MPGPLEARRRLNKRRNMNFASARAGMRGFDAAMLFGRDRDGGRASQDAGGRGAASEWDMGGLGQGVNTFDFNSRGMLGIWLSGLQ